MRGGGLGILPNGLMSSWVSEVGDFNLFGAEFYCEILSGVEEKIRTIVNT